MRKLACLFTIALVFMLVSCGRHKPDSDAIAKIKKEGLQNSKVMDIAFQLTDVCGPRLTNSPGYFRAANWARNQLEKWGLTNAALEPWGDFGKSWELKKFYIALTAPYYRPLIAYPKTWTSGSGGLQHAEVILVKAGDSATLEAYRGKLKGKVALLYRTDTLKQSFKTDATRRTDEELQKMENIDAISAADTTDIHRRREQRILAGAMAARLKDMAAKEGALAVLSMSTHGHDGTLFVQSGGAFGVNDPENILDIMIAMEDYMSMVRLANSGIPVNLDVKRNSPAKI